MGRVWTALAGLGLAGSAVWHIAIRLGSVDALTWHGALLTSGAVCVWFPAVWSAAMRVQSSAPRSTPTTGRRILWVLASVLGLYAVANAIASPSTWTADRRFVLIASGHALAFYAGALVMLGPAWLRHQRRRL